MPDPQPDRPSVHPERTAKLALRDQLVTARSRRSLLEVGEAARAIAEHLLATTEVRRAATVAAYVSIGTEPGTDPAAGRPRRAGQARHPAGRAARPRPRLVGLPRADLAGPRADGPARARRAAARRRRRRHRGRGARPGPGGRPAPGTGWAAAAAATTARWRRVPVGTLVWVLLYDDEVGLDVPVEPHDRKVTGAVTPSGLTCVRSVEEVAR